MTIKQLREKMQKSITFFSEDLNKLRGPQASPHLLEDIKIEAYGQSMPINQVGTISVVNPTLIVINVWDKTNVESIKKAIEKADLGLNPIEEKTSIKIPIPPPSEERRKELVKVIHDKVETTKLAIRNIRKEFLDELDDQKDKSEISEDEFESFQKQLQKAVDEFNQKIDDLKEQKEKDLLQI